MLCQHSGRARLTWAAVRRALGGDAVLWRCCCALAQRSHPAVWPTRGAVEVLLPLGVTVSCDAENSWQNYPTEAVSRVVFNSMPISCYEAPEASMPHV